MWHGRRRGRLSLETEHRLSLIRNLTKELVAHQRVITTQNRAKEAARFAEKLITIAKKKSLHSRRRLIAELGNGTESIAKRLIDVVAPKFSDRQGGYTRILRYKYRQGDGAQLALLEFSVPIETTEKKPRKEKKAKATPSTKEIKEASPKVSKEEFREEKKKSKSEKSEKEDSSKETPKKGGFLGGLRKFLTGKDE